MCNVQLAELASDAISSSHTSASTKATSGFSAFHSYFAVQQLAAHFQSDAYAGSMQLEYDSL